MDKVYSPPLPFFLLVGMIAKVQWVNTFLGSVGRVKVRKGER